MTVWSFPNRAAYDAFVADNPIIPGTEEGAPWVLIGSADPDFAQPSEYADGTIRQEYPLDELQVAWLDSRGVTVI